MIKYELKALALCGILAVATAGSNAKPFASQISVTNKNVVAGIGTSIKYYLNEPADTVLLELIDGSNAVGASFAGSTTRGPNTVSWNGTVDNATGAAAPAGTWRVRVTASKNAAAWSEIASNRSVKDLVPKGTLYNEFYSGFSSNDCVYITDQNSELFGLGLLNICSISPVVVGVAPINSDTRIPDGTDGKDSRLFKSSVLNSSTLPASLWGMCVDPESTNTIYFCSQQSGSNNHLWRGDLNSSATLTRADPDRYLTDTPPRAGVVIRQGGVKYIYLCNSTEIIRAPLDPVTGDVSGPPTTISNFANGRYARGLDLDAEGNLYFVAKHATSGNGGALYRWDADYVKSGNPLSEATATWKVTYPTTMINMMGPAITPSGDVYVAMISGTTTGKITGIFSVGNSSQSTNVKVLAVEDQVVDFTAIGDPSTQWKASDVYFNLRSDPAGNLLAIDRTTEQIRVFGAPGNSSMAVTAPQSQSITLTSGVDSWSLY